MILKNNYREPHKRWEHRFRFFLGMFSVMLVITSNSLNTPDPLKILPDLTWWALYTFVSHWGLGMLIPYPYGFPFYFLLAFLHVVYGLSSRGYSKY
jgi:hypothetical protein